MRRRAASSGMAFPIPPMVGALLETPSNPEPFTGDDAADVSLDTLLTMHEGWLWKRPVTANRLPVWRMRWVVLHEDRLTIHRPSKQAGPPDGTTMLRPGPVDRATAIAVERTPSRVLLLNADSLLRYPSHPARVCVVSCGVVLLLQAEDTERAREWVSALHWALSAVASRAPCA